jgi:alpha-ribazole phosphatase
MKLRLIRHPRPAVVEGLCYGRMDVPPDAAHLQAMTERLAARWRGGARPLPALVFSSPLRRCTQLAEALASSLAADGWPPTRLDARIAEMDFGHWEGTRWNEIPPAELAAWRADIAELAPPGGESLRALSLRALDFVERELLSAALPPDAEVVVVTHAGVIQALRQTLRGEPLAQLGGLRLDFGTITTLVRRQGRFELEAVNEAP